MNTPASRNDDLAYRIARGKSWAGAVGFLFMTALTTWAYIRGKAGAEKAGLLLMALWLAVTLIAVWRMRKIRPRSTR
ncbi:MAG TPA: hypothetical protein VFE31_02530 [Opitutaceae bacterium]|nr:hypothetical protein [Opitutaceae bacterium]